MVKSEQTEETSWRKEITLPPTLRNKWKGHKWNQKYGPAITTEAILKDSGAFLFSMFLLSSVSLSWLTAKQWNQKREIDAFLQQGRGCWGGECGTLCPTHSHSWIRGFQDWGGGGSHLRTREAAYCQEKGSDRELPEAGQWGDLLGSFLSFYAFYLWF